LRLPSEKADFEYLSRVLLYVDKVGATMKSEKSLIDDGFVVLRGIITQPEVARLRLEVDSILDRKGHLINGGTVLPNAAVEAPALKWVFCHERILEAIRLQTGLDELIFTAEADLHRDYLVGGWHKDTGEASMYNGYFDCDWTMCAECRVYKIAIYLQDHLDGSGLSVRPGSTTSQSLTTGDEYSIPLAVGDAVLFDVRLTHRGNSPTLGDKLINRLGDILLTEKRKGLQVALRRWKNRVRRRPDRMAVYFAFGAPNTKSETFANRNMQRQLEQNGSHEFKLSNDLESLFRSSNVRVATIDRPRPK
jgi:hypothetical protein